MNDSWVLDYVIDKDSPATFDHNSNRELVCDVGPLESVVPQIQIH